MKTLVSLLLLAAAFALSSARSFAKEDKPYTEGPVTEVSYIKVKPGMFDTYMKWIATERKQLMEEYKKAGIILDYKVFTTEAHNPSEPDLILTVIYKNMAALDGLDDRTDVVMEKVVGSRQKANDNSIGREKMREVLGSRLVRELVLK